VFEGLKKGERYTTSRFIMLSTLNDIWKFLEAGEWSEEESVQMTNEMLEEYYRAVRENRS
jgi:hypothetical protein